MEESHDLTKGCLAVMLSGGDVTKPILQVLGSKKIASGNVEKDRYRLLVSDGKYMIAFAMLTTQVGNSGSGEITTFSLIRINRYVTSVINNANTAKNNDENDKRILVILDYEVVKIGDDVDGRLYDPTKLPDSLTEIVRLAKLEKLYKNQNEPDASPPPPQRPNYSHAPTKSTTSNEMMDYSQNGTQLTHPIASLSPYQNKWVIKARLTNKSSIRTWSNSRGEGKLFSFELMDESGEIRATAFRDMVDKYYDMLVVDKVYYVSKCQIKMANKQFSNVKNDYEMTLGNESTITECTEGTDSVPTTTFNFVKIDQIANMEVGSIIDIIGVCKHASEMQTFTAKSTGRELKKRELTLVDQSKTSIALTLWGDEAMHFNLENPVVAIKGAKVGEFGGGKNIGTGGSSVLKYNPELPESFSLRGWYDNGGDKEESSNISARSGVGSFESNWMSFKEVKDLGLGNSDKGDYYQTKGTVLLVKGENCLYKACPQENCNKKVINLENGHYRCEKCGAEYTDFKYRLLGSINVGDYSGSQWISVFSTEAELLIGKTAQEIGEASEGLSESEAKAVVQSICSEANFKQFIFKCRAKIERYNDEARLKTVGVRIEPINYKEYNAFLVKQIEQLLA